MGQVAAGEANGSLAGRAVLSADGPRITLHRIAASSAWPGRWLAPWQAEAAAGCALEAAAGGSSLGAEGVWSAAAAERVRGPGHQNG